MKIIKTALILCAFLFIMGVNSVNAQSNPFFNAKISGPATFGHYATGCYELPNVSGASYHWINDCELRISCGDVNIHHAGFVSPYNTGGGWS